MRVSSRTGRLVKQPRLGAPRPPAECVGGEPGECDGEPVPYAPVPLCGLHMRQVYAFARDFIETHVDEAIVEMAHSN